MGLLVGLPLKLFHLAFLAARFLWPVLLIFLVRWGRKKLRQRQYAPRQEQGTGPDFKGPVYTVDYEVVDEEET